MQADKNGLLPFTTTPSPSLSHPDRAWRADRVRSTKAVPKRWEAKCNVEGCASQARGRVKDRSD